VINWATFNNLHARTHARTPPWIPRTTDRKGSSRVTDRYSADRSRFVDPPRRGMAPHLLANVLNKQWRIADKGQPYRLGVGRVVNNFSPYKS